MEVLDKNVGLINGLYYAFFIPKKLKNLFVNLALLETK